VNGSRRAGGGSGLVAMSERAVEARRPGAVILLGNRDYKEPSRPGGVPKPEVGQRGRQSEMKTAGLTLK
jgi:hypothetical protein